LAQAIAGDGFEPFINEKLFFVFFKANDDIFLENL
jgi:hypothetical protein